MREGEESELAQEKEEGERREGRTFLVDPSDVARLEPRRALRVLHERLGRRLGSFQVTEHDVGPGEEHLADLALLDVLVGLGVDDPAAHHRQERADRAALRDDAHVRRRGALGEAVLRTRGVRVSFEKVLEQADETALSKMAPSPKLSIDRET